MSGAGLRLPRAAVVTDELLAAAPPLAAHAVSAARQRVVAALRPLAAELPPGERLVVDNFRLATALRHPERCLAGDQPFAPSPRTCRRAVGLAAVERALRRRVTGPAEAVAAVLADGLEDVDTSDAAAASRAPWWARWYAGLGPGGRAAVAAEAVTWATQLWAAVEWRRLPAPVVVGGRDDWWELPGSRLLLRSRAEVRLRVEGRLTLVVVASGVPDAVSRSELAYAAMVSALVGGTSSAPGRVVGLWPAAGAHRVLPIGERALAGAVEEVVGVVGTWVDALIERHGIGPPVERQVASGA